MHPPESRPFRAVASRHPLRCRTLLPSPASRETGIRELAAATSVSRPDHAPGRLRYQCPAPVPPSPEVFPRPTASAQREGMDLSQDRQNGTGGGEHHACDQDLIRLVQTLPHGDARRDRACETLMARYGHIVRSAVQRHRAAPDLAEDLTQVGYLGLMKAITHFDTAVGSSLAAYAQPCVTGEIKRYFRDKRWQLRVARPAQELRLELRRATDDLAQQLARTPSDTELASHLQITQGEVVAARLAARAFTAASLDAPVSGDDGVASIGELIGDEDPG